MDSKINRIIKKKIIRSTSARFEVIASSISMGVALLVAGSMLYVFFRDVKFGEEGALGGFIVCLTIIAIFGGLFGYFFGYRNFDKAYKLLKSIKKDEYTIKEDIVTNVSTYRYRNSLHYRMALKNCKERIGCSRDILVGQKIFIVYSSDKKAVTYLTTTDYAEVYESSMGDITPEEKEALEEMIKQPEEVEIHGRKIVVGEKEKGEEKLRKEYFKFLTPMYIIDFILCAGVFLLTKSILSAMLCFAAFIFLFFGLSSLLYEIQFKLFGKPVKVKITNLEKLGSAKKATMEFEYDGQIKTITQNVYVKVRENATYDATYVPWTKSISVKKDIKSDKGAQIVCVVIAIVLFVIAWFARVH